MIMQTTRLKLYSLLSVWTAVALLGSLWVFVPEASADSEAAGDVPPAASCPGVTSAPGVGLKEGAPEVKTAHCGCSKGYSQGGCAKCNGVVPPTPAGDVESDAAPVGKAPACGCQGGS